MLTIVVEVMMTIEMDLMEVVASVMITCVKGRWSQLSDKSSRLTDLASKYDKCSCMREVFLQKIVRGEGKEGKQLFLFVKNKENDMIATLLLLCCEEGLLLRKLL